MYGNNLNGWHLQDKCPTVLARDSCQNLQCPVQFRSNKHTTKVFSFSKTIWKKNEKWKTLGSRSISLISMLLTNELWDWNGSNKVHFPIKWGEEEAAEGRKTAAAADLMFAIFPENCSPFSRLPVFSFSRLGGKIAVTSHFSSVSSETFSRKTRRTHKICISRRDRREQRNRERKRTKNQVNLNFFFSSFPSISLEPVQQQNDSIQEAGSSATSTYVPRGDSCPN